MIINKSGGMASRAKLFHISLSQAISGSVTLENIEIPDDEPKGFFLLSANPIVSVSRQDAGVFYNEERAETYYIIAYRSQNPGSYLDISNGSTNTWSYNKTSKTLTLNKIYMSFSEIYSDMTLVVWW